MISLIQGDNLGLPVGIDPKNNICIVITHSDNTKEWFYGSNLVTDDGDIYYAKRGAGVTPATNEHFGLLHAKCVLNNPSSADTIAKTDTYGSVLSKITTSGAEKLVTSLYPITSDTDTDNTGATADTVSYKFEWTTAQIDTSAGNPITGGMIYDTDQASPVSGTKILTHWNFTSPSSFHKTSTDTLKLFVNHTFNGV